MILIHYNAIDDNKIQRKEMTVVVNQDNKLISWFRQYIEEYHEGEKNNSSKYISSMRSPVQLYLLDEFGNRDPADFTINEAEKTVRNIEQNPKVNSQKYANIVFNWFKQFFRFVVDHGGKDENVYELIARPSVYDEKEKRKREETVSSCSRCL